MMLLLFWTGSILVTFMSYVVVALIMDGRIVFGAWVKLWLAGMAILGPLGTLMTFRLLFLMVLEVRREARRCRLKTLHA